MSQLAKLNRYQVTIRGNYKANYSAPPTLDTTLKTLAQVTVHVLPSAEFSSRIFERPGAQKRAWRSNCIQSSTLIVRSSLIARDLATFSHQKFAHLGAQRISTGTTSTGYSFPGATESIPPPVADFQRYQLSGFSRSSSFSESDQPLRRRPVECHQTTTPLNAGKLVTLFEPFCWVRTRVCRGLQSPAQN